MQWMGDLLCNSQFCWSQKKNSDQEHAWVMTLIACVKVFIHHLWHFKILLPPLLRKLYYFTDKWNSKEANMLPTIILLQNIRAMAQNCKITELRPFPQPDLSNGNELGTGKAWIIWKDTFLGIPPKNNSISIGLLWPGNLRYNRKSM